MMRWSQFALAVGAAIGVLAPAAANAAVVVDYADTQPLPAANDFGGALANLGLTRYATGAGLTLDAPATILFEFLGSESGYDDSFEAPGIAFTETSGFEDHFASPVLLGGTLFPAGSLAGLINFLSSTGKLATLGEDSVALFLDQTGLPGQSVSTFYLGFDDQLADQDADFDDMIVRGTVISPVPEPGTWAMMVLGFGLVAFLMRVERRGGSAPRRRLRIA